MDKQYLNLLRDILKNGILKSDRTKTGTISVFGRYIRHDMENGFPLLTTKKMSMHSIMTELKWFMSGDTNIRFLIDNGCNIWNGDAYKEFHQSFPKTEMLSKEQFVQLIKDNDDFSKSLTSFPRLIS